MNKSHLGISVLLLLGALSFLFLQQRSQNIHQLLTGLEAQAYVAFQAWTHKHAKVYRQQDEKNYRFQIFMSNYKVIKEHNARYQQGLETFTMTTNKFADLSNAEFKYLFTGLKKKHFRNSQSVSSDLNVTKQCNGKIQILDKPNETVAWRPTAVGPVRNQGSCGSCWAFSACGALQGLDAILSKQIKMFSPQQLVDCAGGPYQNQGCNGGEMNAAFWYVTDNGIALDKNYKYTAKDGKCAYTSKLKAFQNRDCAEVPANKTKALQSAVSKQPVSISVEADSLQFQFYEKGVFKSKKCGQDLDHGILLTGYGTMNVKNQTLPHWECKNSWDADWGMQGYIYIFREQIDGTDGGMCGILMENQVPLN